MVQLNDVLLTMASHQISFILVAYDLHDDDRDLAVCFVNHLNRSR